MSDATGVPVLLRSADDLRGVLGIEFSDEQLAIVTAPLRPGVVVAGAGSGKTTVMTARVVWLVGTGQVLPAEVLGLTFTNKAAGELSSRVRVALERLATVTGTVGLQEEFGEPTICTYHAYAGSLVAEHGLRLGYEPGVRVMSDATRFQLAARVVTGSSMPVEHLSTHLPTVIESLLSLDAQLQDHLVDIADVREFDRRMREHLAQLPPRHEGRPSKPVAEAVATTRERDELLDLVAAYRALKDAEGVAEFSDQMAAGARLAIECPEVASAARNAFRAVLLDEYQDTSVSQRRMLQGLFSGPPGAPGRGHAVTAVGDPCQGIYGWRGASVDNIDDFGEHFPRRDGSPADSFSLRVNRRCAGRILEAANSLASPLFDVHKAAEPLAPRPDAPAGNITVALHDTVTDEIAWVPAAVAGMRLQLEQSGPPARWSDIAVLVRNRQELAELSGALRRAQVPAEVVGLAGLLTQPEVADVVAMLRVVSDLTANAALLRVLTGPRWRIGVRDLALLGERSAELVRSSGSRRDGDLSAALDSSVQGADPAEVASLSDALADPGDKGYSPEALERYATLAAELSALRRAAGEPLVELVRRVVLTLGLDIELAAAEESEARQAADNLALLIDTVADFAARDPFASVHGLVAYLDAEMDFNRGMTVAETSCTDSVKLLTVHTAKGLEWRGVLVPFLSSGVFPSAKGFTRWEWTARDAPWPLRGDSHGLPALDGWTGRTIEEYSAQCRAHAELEERRLVYVAVTRAKELLVASGHWWGRTQVKPRGPSAYLSELSEHVDLTTQTAPWLPEAPPHGATNPVIDAVEPVFFPAGLDERKVRRRRRAARAVHEALAAGTPAPTDPPEDAHTGPAVLAETGIDLAALDAEIARLVAEAQEASGGVEVELPPLLSTTAIARLRADPEGFARDLARPMPRKPSAAARFGTRFHRWVETTMGQQSFLDPTDLPGRDSADILDEDELARLKVAFAAGPFAERVPVAVEWPFTLLLGGQSVIGRIDAVYESADGFEVVDWKTGRHEGGDPLQLAIYRLAWAEANEVPVGRVTAAFHFVRSGRVVRPQNLPARAALEEVVRGARTGGEQLTDT